MGFNSAFKGLNFCCVYKLIIVAPIHYFHSSVTQRTENFPVRNGRTERPILNPATKKNNKKDVPPF
jgi:hypothetical protein